MKHKRLRGSNRFLFGGAATTLALIAAAGCSGTAPPPSSEGLASQTGAGTNGSGGSGNTSAGGSSDAGRGGGISVTGGAGGGIVPMAGTAGSGMDCAATSEKAKLLPLDLYMVTDSSKSMLQTTLAGASKWDALKNAMSGFFADPGGEGLSVALKFFPDVEPTVPATCASDADCGAFGPCAQRRVCVVSGTSSSTFDTLCTADADCTAGCPEGQTCLCAPVQECPDGPNCTPVYCVSGGAANPCPAECVPFENYCNSREVCAGANYAAPVVAMTELPAGAPALTEALNARMPDGYTPTGPALTGAIQFAQAHQTANPTRKVGIVLVTDGLPGGFIPGSPPPACIPSDVPGVSTLVQMAAMGTPPVPVFVIGLFGPCDLADQNIKPQENLDLWAASGGTEKAIMISTDTDVVQELKNALAKVRTAAIACRYTTPDVPAAQIDFFKVNVTYGPGTENHTTVNYVTNAAGCDATTGGWYYDVDPKAGGKPSEIIACDQSCATFQTVQNVQVNVSYGCPTVEPK
jgi:hypothetical protein